MREEQDLGDVACSIHTCVGIVSFCVDTTIVYNPFESIVHVSPVTPIVSAITIHKFLFWKANKVSGN